MLFPDEEGVHYEVAHSGGAPLTGADLTESGLAIRRPILASEGRIFRYVRLSDHTRAVTSLLALPLTSRGRVLGLLLAVREGGAPFVEGQRKLLTILADRAAAAVHNCQLFESLERNFRTSIDPARTYTSITLRGSANTAGRTCTGAAANTLCQALRTGASSATVSVACGGFTWSVGQCYAGQVELDVGGAFCSCASTYTARPCHLDANFGGLNGASCGAANQTLIVNCQ